MASKKILNLNDPDDILRIHKILFEESDDDGSPGTSSNTVREPDYDLDNEDNDIDASENIEAREDDSNTEQSDTESECDKEEEDDFYICNRKKGDKIVESFSRKKKLPTLPGRKPINVIC